MTDQPATETVAQPVEPTPAQGAPVEPTTTQETYDQPRAMDLINKLRGEIKDLKPLAKKAADFEAQAKAQAEKDMTELQKAQAQIKELEEKTKAADLREMRRKVGEAAKLPAAIYELLPELPEAEMAIKAAELAKAIPQSTTVLSPTNPGAGSRTVTDEQRRAFIFGNGPLA